MSVLLLLQCSNILAKYLGNEYLIWPYFFKSAEINLFFYSAEINRDLLTPTTAVFICKS
mgnify:CR=1 FL=1